MRHDATREARKAGVTIPDGIPDRALSQKGFFYTDSLRGETSGAGFDEQDNLAGWWVAIIVRVDDGEFLIR
jgi:hypothetical protein